MVIFQPQQISQLLKVRDVKDLGHWVQLLSKNLHQLPVALNLEVPRPGLGILTVTTAQEGPGYLFYFQFKSGIQINDQTVLKNAFVLIASAGQQPELLAKLRTGLTDKKFFNQLRYSRSKHALYKTIATKLQFALQAPAQNVELPNETLDLVPSSNSTGLELVVQPPVFVQQDLVSEPDLSSKSSLEHGVDQPTADSSSQLYFETTDFILGTQDQLGADDQITPDDPDRLLAPSTDHTPIVKDDETEYLLRYYEYQSTTQLVPFSQTQYFLNVVPEPFLILRQFGDYFHSPIPVPDTNQGRPVPLVDPEPTDAITPAPTTQESVLEPDYAFNQKPVVTPVEIPADIETFVPPIEPVPVVEPITVPATIQVLSEPVTITEFEPCLVTDVVLPPPATLTNLTPLTDQEVSFTTLSDVIHQEQFVAEIVAPDASLAQPPELEPAPSIELIPESLPPQLPAIADTSFVSVDYYYDELDLFDVNAFDPEDFNWLSQELPDPSLDMDLESAPSNNPADHQLVDLGSGLAYKKREWMGQQGLIQQPVVGSNQEWVYWQELAQQANPPQLTWATGIKNILVVITASVNRNDGVALLHWINQLNDHTNYRVMIETQTAEGLTNQFTRQQIKVADLVLYTPGAKKLRRFKRYLCYQVSHDALSNHPLLCVLDGLKAKACAEQDLTWVQKWWFGIKSDQSTPQSQAP